MPGYSNLGEVTDYIPEIVFTALIADVSGRCQSRQSVVQFLGAA